VGGVVGDHSATAKYLDLLFVMIGVRTLVFAGESMSFYRHMSCNPELRLSLTATSPTLLSMPQFMITARINAAAKNL